MDLTAKQNPTEPSTSFVTPVTKKRRGYFQAQQQLKLDPTPKHEPIDLTTGQHKVQITELYLDGDDVVEGETHEVEPEELVFVRRYPLAKGSSSSSKASEPKTSAAATPKRKDPEPESTEQSANSIEVLQLKCYQVDCREAFPNKDQLHAHLLDAHDIRPSRCLDKFCGQSFYTAEQLSKHYRALHANQQQWTCAFCDRTFKSSQQLYRHNSWSHVEGRFRCGNAQCSFSGTTRGEIYAHHKQKHREFHCEYPSCAAVFHQQGNYTRHLRMHYRVKPYACGWRSCGYRSEYRSTALNHIRVAHFKLPPTVRKQQEQGIVDRRDPRQYLRVDEQQLAQIKQAIGAKV